MIINWLRKRSIKDKITYMMLTIGIFSIGLGFCIVIFNDIAIFKRDMVNNTRLISRVISNYSISELMFDDSDASYQTLKKLASVPIISHAFIFNQKGELFARYDKGDSIAPPLLVTSSPAYYKDDRLYVYEQIESDHVVWGTICLVSTIESLEQKISRYILTMLGIMLVIIVLVGILAKKFQSYISTPILRLAEIVRKVSQTNDYTIRAKTANSDEIGYLYSGFNNMLEKIENRERELHQNQEKLHAYSLDLERSNQELNQFAYVTSHDLKAPLRAIANLSEWIEEDIEALLTPDTRGQMNLLRSRVHRMEALIQGILEYSRAGRIRNALEKVNLTQLLEETIDLMDPPEHIKITIGADLPELLTEKVRLQQVFSNLISNAIKYNDKEIARIDIQMVNQDDDFYWFCVADNGPGIEPKYHDKVFVIFQTLQSRDKFESTGVGLSIVKKIVEDQGGMIWIEGDKGEGASFIFKWSKKTDTTYNSEHNKEDKIDESRKN